MSSLNKCNTVSVFDVDGTLIKNNIGVTFVKYLLRNKKVKVIPKVMIIALYPLYKIGVLDFKYAILMGAWALAGQKEEITKQDAIECFKSEIKDYIYEDGKTEINKRKQLGDYIVLATGAHSSIAQIFGDFVGANSVIATNSYVEKGKFTLKVYSPLPYREGKRDLVFKHIKQFCQCSQVRIYTDEAKDIYMLRDADSYVGVNADDVIKEFIISVGGELKYFS